MMQAPSDPSPPRDEAPDQDVLEAIAEGTRDEADHELTARVKRRLLRRIAEQETPRHATVQAADDAWRPFGKGLQIKVLHQAEGVMSYLVRMAPGSALPAHRHPVEEECVVLEGSVQIGELHVQAGGFHLGRKDVLHDRVATVDGALIYLRGAVPAVEQIL
jgi:hypothetical protein